MSSATSSAPDLHAVTAFLNTYDELNDPRDGLTSVDVVRRVLRRHGLDAMTADLDPSDLEELRELRERLRQVFVATSDAARADVINGLLRDAHAEIELRADESGWQLGARSSRRGLGPLMATFATALARVIADGAGDRLGVCAAHPCHCVFVDRSRSRRQRYCCELCNDRVAAAAYRRRAAGH